MESIPCNGNYKERCFSAYLTISGMIFFFPVSMQAQTFAHWLSCALNVMHTARMYSNVIALLSGHSLPSFS